MNNVEDGYGKVTTSSGESYRGSWKNGELEKHGIYKYSNNNNQKIEKYSNGVATKIYNNGFIYVGEWKNKKRHGKGTLKHPKGIYEGIIY